MSNDFPEPSIKLFDNIIVAIRNEQEKRRTRNLLFSFFLLLIISFTALPFSSLFFAREWSDSGVSYFITTAITNPDIFILFWQNFILSIIEALPLLAIISLAINFSLILFTVRLFLYRKNLLLNLVFHAR